MADLLRSLFLVQDGVFGVGLFLVSSYSPVSGSGFDAERRVLFDKLWFLLTKLHFRSVWVLGDDFNAEVGSRVLGRQEHWVSLAMADGQGSATICWSGLVEKISAFCRRLQDKVGRGLVSIRRS